MRKVLLLMMVGILVFSGLGAVAINYEKSYDLKIMNESIIISKPSITEIGQYVTVNIEESTSFLLHAGKPVLPVITKVFTLPFGSKINRVDIIFSEVKEQLLLREVQPGSRPVTSIAGMQVCSEPMKDTTIYDSPELYPSSSYSYTIKAGLYGEEHVVLLAVQCYPIRYSPVQNMIYYSNTFDINIIYEEPSSPVTFPDEYDLVIIAPKTFSDTLQPLVDHKNSCGIDTKLKTVEDIYSEYDGRDKPEQIKYFIKDAFETCGIKYVLIVGGIKGQRFDWYVPVRYSLLNDGSESSFISDLYYADLYKFVDNKTVFDDWDSNGNDVFAEWNAQGKDILDLTPDVCLGRLPCRYIFEVKIMVDKIINYENTVSGKDWFNKMVVVGGDSAPGDKYYEGEEENKKALEYMEGFEGIKLWTSDGSFNDVSDVVNAISGGCGFLFFDGHGNPSTWSTHPPDDKKTWVTGLNNHDMPKLKNGEKLPVAVVGACHNGQFDVCLMNILKGILEEGFNYFGRSPLGSFWYNEWVPECWAWRMTSKMDGGAIAIMAYSGLDWFAVGDYDNDGIPDCTQYFSGYANTHFFKNYGMNNMTILGQAHTQTLVDYISELPIDWNLEVDWERPYDSSTLMDCKTIQEFTLMGDPSLKIGGY
jgi:hypothetical protein